MGNITNSSRFLKIFWMVKLKNWLINDWAVLWVLICTVHMTVWPNGWVFLYKLNGCGFESRCSHLNLKYRACFEQGVPWHSGKYRVWIHSQTRTWHDKNIQSGEQMLQNIHFFSYWTKCFNEYIHVLKQIFTELHQIICKKKIYSLKCQLAKC